MNKEDTLPTLLVSFFHKISMRLPRYFKFISFNFILTKFL